MSCDVGKNFQVLDNDSVVSFQGDPIAHARAHRIGTQKASLSPLKVIKLGNSFRNSGKKAKTHERDTLVGAGWLWIKVA